MIQKKRQQGVTLIELLVVATIITLLTAVGLPAFRALNNAFESGGSVERMINSMLTTARSKAIQGQRYVGVRFQKRFRNDPLAASQYMILIERDSVSTGIQSGFKAVQGLKPVKLPDSVGVMDLNVADPGERKPMSPETSPTQTLDEDPNDSDELLNDLSELRDVTTFSVIFSPQGHLVVHGVRVRNNSGKLDGDSSSPDDVFNTFEQVNMGNAQFLQDDYFEGSVSESATDIRGLGPEASRLSFVIFKTEPFINAYNQGQAWTGYLHTLQRRYGNRYTGALTPAKP